MVKTVVNTSQGKEGFKNTEGGILRKYGKRNRMVEEDNGCGNNEYLATKISF
jgi:hypothetical protein